MSFFGLSTQLFYLNNYTETSVRVLNKNNPPPLHAKKQNKKIAKTKQKNVEDNWLLTITIFDNSANFFKRHKIT